MIREQLNDNAYSLMTKFFAGKGHRPSAAMLFGLQRAQETLTDMLLGDADRKYYLCSLDPGVGKSTAEIQWLRVYLGRPESETEGVIICLNRLEEIGRFISEGGIPENHFAVFVSDNSGEEDEESGEKAGKKLNVLGLGKERANKAPILFTTKAQIQLRARHGKRLFKDIEEFYYKGKPRRVRIWDESLTVGRGLTLERYALSEVFNTLNKKYPNAAAILDDVYTADLPKCQTGSVYQFPDIGLTPNEILSVFPVTSIQRKTAETIALMSGKAVTVRIEGKGRTCVDYVDELPSDFAPCLITDASGRIRETYNLQREYRGDVIDITPEGANKRYDPLTINRWSRGSGKSAYANGNTAKEIAGEVNTVIDSKPGELFLILCHKGHLKKLKELVFKGRKPEDKERINFLTWGRHTATNDYAHIPNIIVASTLFYKVAEYEALGRSAATYSTAKGVFTEVMIDRVRKGELAHNLLQGICRGIVRKCIGNTCPSATVWLIVSPNTGIKELLTRIFPGCAVKEWKTKAVASLSPDSKQRVFDFIVQTLGAKKVITVLEVRKKFGLNASNFKRDYLRNSTFRRKLEQEGVIIEGSGRGCFFAIPDYSYYFGEAA